MKKNRGWRISIFVVCFIILAAGCFKVPETKQEPIFVEAESTSESLCNEQEDVLLIRQSTLPVLETKDRPALERIDEFLKKEIQKDLEFIQKEGIRQAVEDYAYHQGASLPYNPHLYNLSYEIGINDGTWFSILFIQDSYTGGAHPMTVWKSWTFQVDQGSVLGLEDVFRTDRSEAISIAVDLVKESAEKKVAEGILTLYEDSSALMTTFFDPDDFYIAGENLRLYYQAYTIAPYAAGFVYFDIPLEETALR